MIRFENVSYKYPETEKLIFEDLSIILPDGIVSLIGQNGTGKSTMLLLAGARLLPIQGKVFLNEKDTSQFKSEEERARYASYIYQNMEFETQDNVGTLLEYVYEKGYHKEKKSDFIPELINIFELTKVLNKRTQEISKGELQRVILAFSLLYGAPTIMMDEPIFALEEYQKHRALEYIVDYAKREKLNIYYSLHELELTYKYSEHIVLFYKKALPRVGTTAALYKNDIIEAAYEIPFHMLKTKETIFRDVLIKIMGKSEKS